MSVRIVTDSCADIPKHVAEQKGISIVPLNVHFGEIVFKDGIEITPHELLQRVEQTHVYPKTSQPAPGDFVKVYEELLQQEDAQIVSIHLSSGISGTYQSAVMAKEILGTDRIVVIDSFTASSALGCVAMAAADKVEEGASLAEVVKFVEYANDRTRIFLIVDSLEYLANNGRIGRAASMVGTLLNIKPILTVEDGIVDVLDKVRGRKKARKRIVELAKKECEEKNGRLYAMVLHLGAQEQAEGLYRDLKDTIDVAYLSIDNVGCVIGSNIGPGAFGVAGFFTNK